MSALIAVSAQPRCRQVATPLRPQPSLADIAHELFGDQAQALTDPTLRQIYIDYDRAHGLDPQDPFITDLARRIIDATRQRYGTGDLPGQATGSEIPQLIQGAVNASSPAWQRLDFLIREELHRASEAADD